PAMVAIDGCELGCTKAILEHAEITTKSYLVLTELGIKKNKDFNLKADDIQKVKAAIKSVCK
ncbi:MAG TPA: putative zinc-binding protein, partial [Desulfobacterales bacterium]|nr:putative zinc-binding protein [Desulfobacterales bacterium]